MLQEVGELQWLKQKLAMRNSKWTSSDISQAQRSMTYNHKSALVIVTGQKDSGKKPLAKQLEMELFRSGKKVYFMGIGNILYGVDADIQNEEISGAEHFRRIAEVAHLMLDAGLIIVLTAIHLQSRELEIFQTLIDPSKIHTVWLGQRSIQDLPCDLVLEGESRESDATEILDYLQCRGVIFDPN